MKQQLFWFSPEHKIDNAQLVEQILSDYAICQNISALCRKYRVGRKKITNIITKKRIFQKLKSQPSNLDIYEFCNNSKGRSKHAGPHKLSDNQENQVRQRYKSRMVTLRALGKEFGVSYQTIANIVKKYKN